MKRKKTIRIGTAGWSLPPMVKDRFPSDGTHLQRYATRFKGCEINSSFYRTHKPETYAKWASMVPADFQFSVKLLRYFTQEKRLRESGNLLQETLEGISLLGPKFGVLLVQLPPSLEFEKSVVETFLSSLRSLYTGDLAFEPRHASWKHAQSLDLLSAFQVGKVRADPEPCLVVAQKRPQVEPFLYYRLHGQPEIYKSPYSAAVINKVAQHLSEAQAQGKKAWCIFDNTTLGHATQDALDLMSTLEQAAQWPQQMTHQ